MALPDKVIISGLPPLDGEYEFDVVELLNSLTNRELHKIKVMSGVRAGELDEALEAGDSDLFLAIALIVLQRRGRRVDEDMLWDAPAGSGVTLDIADREFDADPPPSRKSEDERSSTSGSGSSSTPTSESRGNGQSRTGTRDSGITAASARPTSGT